MIERLQGHVASDITSAQILTDTTSIVKELLENALDAHSTSIKVTLFDHGLEQITVTDNGSGIAKDDCCLVIRPHHTSKMRCITDLAKVSFYGFRGQALASLATISESIELCTRTAEDSTASCWQTNDQKCLYLAKTTGQPQGTTITVKNPWYRLPVRRQHMRAKAASVTQKVKDMVASYSLVHLSVTFRMVFRKTSKSLSEQTIIRRPHDTLMAALASLHGASFLRIISEDRWETSNFRLHACLPQVKQDCKLPCKAAHYVYVNNRPMSLNRGIGKSILTRVRQAIRTALPQLSRDVCIFLHIQCKPSSYDVNVEPSKDVVFFHTAEEDDLFLAIDKLLDKVYDSPSDEGPAIQKMAGMKLQAGEPHLRQRSSSIAASVASDEDLLQDPDLLSAGRPLEEPSSPVCIPLPRSSSPSRQPDDILDWGTSMFDESLDLEGDALSKDQLDRIIIVTTSGAIIPEDDLVEDYAANQSSLTNPWTLAMLNNFRRQRNCNLTSASTRKTLPAEQVSKATTTRPSATSTMQLHGGHSHVRCTSNPKRKRTPSLEKVSTVAPPSRGIDRYLSREKHSAQHSNDHRLKRRKGHAANPTLVNAAQESHACQKLSDSWARRCHALDETESVDQVHDLSTEMVSNHQNVYDRHLQASYYGHFPELSPCRSGRSAKQTLMELLAVLSGGLHLWIARAKDEPKLAIFVSKSADTSEHNLRLW